MAPRQLPVVLYMHGGCWILGLAAAGTLDELRDLPPALVIVDENDILRDQGEAYACKLRDADVPTACVRFNGAMHDFMMLAALRDTETTRAAMNLAAPSFRRAFVTSPS